MKFNPMILIIPIFLLAIFYVAGQMFGWDKALSIQSYVWVIVVVVLLLFGRGKK